MTARKLLVTCAVIWVLCFAWAFVAPSWWAPLLSVAALVGAVLAAGWLSFAHGNRAEARQAAEEQQSLLVDREVKASLTDEALAWAVATWRKRYL